MKRKLVFSIVFFVLVLGEIQAQPGSFAIKITQVYPVGGVVYGNNYNLSGEQDKAEAKLRSQYTGKDANYIMELTYPSGKETKVIQNIYWILIENGKKKNLNSKPRLQDYYLEPTNIEYYSCDIRGNKKDEFPKIDYEYFYRFYKGNNEPFENKQYYLLDSCKKIANEYFKNHKVDSLFCKIVICNSKGIVDSTINNLKEYNNIQKQKKIADSISSDKTKTKAAVQNKAPENKDVDSIKNVKELLLQRLKMDADSLKTVDENLLQKKKRIIEEADKIIKEMKIDPKEFDRNRYFKGNWADLIKGIQKLQELVKINNKQKK
jgi:hypothetical protein